MAAGEMNHLAVVMGGDDTRPKTSLSGGGVWSKMPTKENIVNFFKGLKSGQNHQAAPPREDVVPAGSGKECLKEKPIIAMMKEQELGKSVFSLAVPMSMGLMFFKCDTLSPAMVHGSVVANAVGCTAIWIGLLLRKTCPWIASTVEQVGVSSVFLGFHILVWNFLPPELRFVPAVCLCFSLLPFVIAATPGGSSDEQDDVACTM